MFVGRVSIPEGIFVGDEIVSSPLLAKFRAVAFGETREIVVDLIKVVVGESLANAKIGGNLIRGSATPIEEYLGSSSMDEFKQSDILGELYIAIRVAGSNLIKAGIFQPDDSGDSGFLWLRVVEGAKVRTFGFRIEKDTSTWVIVDAIYSRL